MYYGLTVLVCSVQPKLVGCLLSFSPKTHPFHLLLFSGVDSMLVAGKRNSRSEDNSYWRLHITKFVIRYAYAIDS